jgi:hypothetical protein
LSEFGDFWDGLNAFCIVRWAYDFRGQGWNITVWIWNLLWYFLIWIQTRKYFKILYRVDPISYSLLQFPANVRM